MANKTVSNIRTDNAAVAPVGTEPIETVQSATSAAFVFSELSNHPLNAQTGTAYTLVLTDQGKAVTMNNAAANILTIPLNASVAFHIGAKLLIRQIGAGGTTVVGDGGVTVELDANASLVMDGSQQQILLHKTATDTWHAAPVATGAAAVAGFHGAKVSDSDTVARTATALVNTYDTEVYDTDGFATISGTTDRLTIPAGVTKVQLSGHIDATGIPANTAGYMAFNHFNSSDALQREYGSSIQTGNTLRTQISTSPVISVAEGDYFTMETDYNDASWDQIFVELSIEYKDGTLVEAVAVPKNSPDAGRVSRSTNLLVGAGSVVNWTTEDYDDNNFATISGTTDRLTVPTGVTRVNLDTGLESTGHTVGGLQRIALILYSSGGSNLGTIAANEAEMGDTTPSLSVTALGFPVTAGQYVRVFVDGVDASWTITDSYLTMQDVSP